jgi:hypothetical protein
MPSDKDKCFEEATRAYEDATGKKLGIDFQRPWVQDRSGTWAEAPAESTFSRLMGSILKTLRIQNGDQLPRAPGAPNPVQARYPDMTVTRPDGSKIVVDNKFTGADGRTDPWRTTPGTNGKTQQEDYNDINRQNTNGDPNAQNLSLDKDSCKCNGDPQPERVPVPVPSLSPFFMPLPAPGGVPMPAPVEPMPLPELVPIF